ncbi:MAG: TonB-dependent receptor, partial [bacterium]
PSAVTVADFPLANFNPKAISASPNAYLSATLGDRFFEDQSLGLIVSGTYQHTYRGSNSLFYPTTASQQTSLPEITDLDNRIYSTLQTRSGVMANLDYRANETNTFQLFGMYADLNSLEVRDEYDSILGLSWPKTIRIPWARRVTNEDQAISNVTLSGIHQIFGKDLEADWKLVYSRAALDRPDRAELDLYGGVDLDSAGVYHPQQYLVNGGSPRTWITSTDQDKSVYLNLKTTENILDTKTEFTYGGMYRNKERHATYDKYDLRPNNKFRVQNYNGDITLDTFTVFNPQGSPDDPLNYDAHENITAGFLQAKFQVGQIQAIGGVRVENTDFGWNSQAPEVFDGKSGTITYMDILPSVSLKYMPTDNQNWRLSFFRSISRPGFFEVIPNLGVPGEDYTETTNDTLNRTQATNIDLRWEYFPGGLDQILVGAFYKNLHDPIEYSVVEVLTKTFYEPRNWGDATNYGFEVDLRKYFSEFGIHANYTFTSSNITTDKRVNYRSTDPKIGLTYRVESQTRPLQGQSAHIANLSLLYKNFETGTDCQLGLVYTGANIVGVSPYKDNDVWQRPIIQVDLSGEQKLIGNLALYLKINNLLNSPREEEIRQSYTQGIAPILNQTAGSNFLVRRETYDRTYIIGLKFRM